MRDVVGGVGCAGPQIIARPLPTENLGLIVCGRLTGFKLPDQIRYDGASQNSN